MIMKQIYQIFRLAYEMTLMPKTHLVNYETDCKDFSLFEEPLRYIKHLQP